MVLQTDSPDNVLSIQIDQRWSAFEMSQSISAFDNLYYVMYLVEFEKFKYLGGAIRPSPQYSLDDSTKPRDAKLQIRRIQFASPGSKDFLGLGTCLEQVFKLVQWWFDRDGAELRKLEVEKTKLELGKMRIEMAREFLELRKEQILYDVLANKPKHDFLVDQIAENMAVIKKLMDEKKITDLDVHR